MFPPKSIFVGHFISYVLPSKDIFRNFKIDFSIVCYNAYFSPLCNSLQLACSFRINFSSQFDFEQDNDKPPSNSLEDKNRLQKLRSLDTNTKLQNTLRLETVHWCGHCSYITISQYSLVPNTYFIQYEYLFAVLKQLAFSSQLS